jgi:hypothetical protein
MPNISTKIQISQLERAGVYYYDSIIPFFQKEIDNYKMKNHLNHLIALQDRCSNLEEYRETFFSFHDAYFSAIHQIGKKELNCQNFIDSVLGYTEESMVNLFASCFRSVFAQFESRVNHRNFQSLKLALEKLFKQKIQKKLEQDLILALQAEARLCVSKNMHDPEILRFREYCQILLEKEITKLSALPLLKEAIPQHTDMKRFSELLIHAHELEFSVSPKLLQCMGYNPEHELPLKAKQLITKFRSRLNSVELATFTSELTHLVFDNPISLEQIYRFVMLMISHSNLGSKFMKTNFHLLYETLVAREDIHGHMPLVIIETIKQLGIESEHYDDLSEFKNHICDLFRAHESEELASQVKRFQR